MKIKGRKVRYQQVSVLWLCVAIVFFLSGFSYFEPAPLEESTASLSNPYRGFYRIYGYRLTDSWNGSVSDITKAVSKDTNTRLALVLINLRDYREGTISETGLSQLQAILDAWSASGKALILRFLYDWEGKAEKTEPDTLTTVYRHMNQVTPIINQYKKNIYLIQGVFLGDYGEMHSSALIDETTGGDVIRSLAEYFAYCTDPSIFLAVRTPAQLRKITNSRLPLSRTASYNGTLAARLGLFNDGMLGSATDLGTYASADSRPIDLSGARLRFTELYFQNLLCRYVPNGGEVVLDNPYNDLQNAIADLTTMHISYLDIDYDKNVLTKWKNTPYTGEGPFHGQDGYTYIKEHLGYRYVVRSCTLTPTPTTANAATMSNTLSSPYTLTTTIENTGFSPCYRPLEVTLTLTPQDPTSQPITIPIQTDTRYWNSGNTTLTLPLDTTTYSPDTYTLTLHIQDPLTAEQITCANTTANTTPAGGVPLGTLTISTN
jgi:hypothetical protein